MNFAAAVKRAPTPVPAALRKGKEALKGEYRALVDCDQPRRFTGSVDLDGALKDQQPSANRWDYGIGFREANDSEVAIWVEVHPASTAEVRVVLQKLTSLKTWLRTSAPDLWAISRRWSDDAKAFHWLATASGTAILKNSPEARRIQAAGLDLPRRRLTLT